MGLGKKGGGAARPSPAGKHEALGRDVGALVDRKNKAYGDSFTRSGEVLRVLYPSGVRPEQYEDMLGVCRVLDKFFRIAADRDAFGESPWKDVAGYGLLGTARGEGGFAGATVEEQPAPRRRPRRRTRGGGRRRPDPYHGPRRV